MDVDYWLRGICFTWDRRKGAANFRKHSVRFETASEVFFDPFVRWITAEVVDGEERETVIGVTPDWQLLVVVYADRGDSMRLISARSATRQEREAYED